MASCQETHKKARGPMQINKAAAKLVIIVSTTYRSCAEHFAVEVMCPVERVL
jgi:hypothetical protein